MVIKRKPIKRVDDDEKFEVVEGAATDRENLNVS
jgi:hypothetical protein